MLSPDSTPNRLSLSKAPEESQPNADLSGAREELLSKNSPPGFHRGLSLPGLLEIFHPHDLSVVQDALSQVTHAHPETVFAVGSVARIKRCFSKDLAKLKGLTPEGRGAFVGYLGELASLYLQWNDCARVHVQLAYVPFRLFERDFEGAGFHRDRRLRRLLTSPDAPGFDWVLPEEVNEEVLRQIEKGKEVQGLFKPGAEIKSLPQGAVALFRGSVLPHRTPLWTGSRTLIVVDEG